MEYFEQRLREIGGEEARRRAIRRESMRRYRVRAAEAGYEPDIWARQTIWDARRRAKKAGLPMTIDSAWVLDRLEKIVGRCEVSGVPFSDENPGRAHKRPFMPSLDRINCEGGYTPDNVRIVCVAVNTLLQDWGDGVFMTLFAHQNPIGGVVPRGTLMRKVA